MNPLFDLTGQVAIVTGRSRGLGQYFARALARAGADLVLTSRKLDAVKPFQEHVEDLGGALSAWNWMSATRTASRTWQPKRRRYSERSTSW